MLGLRDGTVGPATGGERTRKHKEAPKAGSTQDVKQ